MAGGTFCRGRSQHVEIDAATSSAGCPRPGCPLESTGPVVVLSAHLDTVFPAGTPLNPAVDGDRLEAPGACDNGAGLVGMLAIAHALVKAKVDWPRHWFSLAMWARRAKATCADAPPLRQSALAGRIAAHIVLDGAGRTRP